MGSNNSSSRPLAVHSTRSGLFDALNIVGGEAIAVAGAAMGVALGNAREGDLLDKCGAVHATYDERMNESVRSGSGDGDALAQMFTEHCGWFKPPPA